MFWISINKEGVEYYFLTMFQVLHFAINQTKHFLPCQRYMKKHRRKHVGDHLFMQLTSNCTDFIERRKYNLTSINVLLSWMKLGVKIILAPCNNLKSKKNPESNFLILGRYFTKPLTEEEAQFPIAYSILFYNDLQQTEKLLRAIYHPQNIYCVHLDKKVAIRKY